MDIDNLNNNEVKIIIDKLKHPKKLIKHQQIMTELSKLPMTDIVDIDEWIIDDDGEFEYGLHAYRGLKKETRFSISLRFKENNHHIIRIDTNPSNRHQNPDGTIITGSHLHIYNNDFLKKDRIAIPIEDTNFPNVTTLMEAFEEFLRYTNIKEG